MDIAEYGGVKLRAMHEVPNIIAGARGEMSELMKPVLKRLAPYITQENVERYITEKKLYNRIDSVYGAVDLWTYDRQSMVNKIHTSYGNFQANGQNDEVGVENLQNLLIGYLFTQNRALFNKNKGSMGAYDYGRERRQVEGVLRSIQGEHLHMGTGEGKSSVVIPIAGLIQAITSDRHDVIMSSSNGTLLGELKTNTESFGKALDRLKLWKEPIEYSDGKRGNGTNKKNNELQKDMEKEVVAGAKVFSKETRENIKKEHWNQFFHDLENENDEGYMQRDVALGIKPRIFFATEKDLVFKYMEDRQVFKENCPSILMDEADMAYNRGTPYQTTSEILSASPEEIRNSTAEWLMYYMASRQIKIDDLVPSGGSYELSEGKKIEINFPHGSYPDAFPAGIDILLNQRGINLNEKQKRVYKNRMMEHMRRQYPKETRKEFISTYANTIARMLKENEKAFMLGKEGQLVLRDSYIDELMSEHKYDHETQLAALAITGRFEVVGRQLANATIRFPTFVHEIGDRLTCFSGTLMYPDPLTSEVKKGSFARFLEKETKRNVSFLSPPDVKRVPRPSLLSTEDEAHTKMLEELQKTRNEPNCPTLVIDFNGLRNVGKTYNTFKAHYGEDKVVLLPPKPSGDELEELEYKNRLDDVTKRLASGQIQVLVSSGAAATGINIVKEDGSFPDLRVAMLGMPDSEQLLVQAVGRRRAKEIKGKSRFYWHVGKDTLDGYISMYKEKRYPIKYGKEDISRAEMKEKLEKAEQDPEESMKLLIEFMRKRQSQNAEGNNAVIEYDDFYSDIAQLCSRRIMRRVREEVLQVPLDVISTANLTPDEQAVFAQEKFIMPEGRPMNNTEKERYKEIFALRKLQENIGLNDEQKELLRIYAEEIGLPASLYWDILQERNFADADTGFTLSPRKAQFDNLKKHILPTFDTYDPSPLKGWIDEWYTSSMPSAIRYIRNVYYEYFKAGFNERGEKGQMVSLSQINPSRSAEMIHLRSDSSNSPYTILGFSDKTQPGTYWLHILDEIGQLLRPQNVINGQPFSSPKLNWEVDVLPFGDVSFKGGPVYFMYLSTPEISST